VSPAVKTRRVHCVGAPSLGPDLELLTDVRHDHVLAEGRDEAVVVELDASIALFGAASRHLDHEALQHCVPASTPCHREDVTVDELVARVDRLLEDEVLFVRRRQVGSILCEGVRLRAASPGLGARASLQSKAVRIAWPCPQLGCVSAQRWCLRVTSTTRPSRTPPSFANLKLAVCISQLPRASQRFAIV
jgi:hypothetical protein